MINVMPARVMGTVFVCVGILACGGSVVNASDSENKVVEMVEDDRGIRCKKNPKEFPCRWRKDKFTYGFEDPTPNIKVPRTEFEIAVKRAFDTWAATGDVSFTRIADPDKADFVVRWRQQSAADTPIAHGDPPPMCALELFPCLPKPLTFYDRRPGMVWKVQGKPVDPNAYDVESVAVHEIGHLLGLFHCEHDNRVACTGKAQIMQGSTNPGDVRRQLTPEDIKDLRRRYAAKSDAD